MIVTALLPLAFAATFHGYDCKTDCSGHEAGYVWAAKHMYDDPAQCRGKSQSFIEGCQAWIEEQAKPDCEDDPESCAEEGLCDDENEDGECGTS